MTTLVFSYYAEPKVTQIAFARNTLDAIERQVSQACESRRIIGLQAEVVHDAALKVYRDGGSPAAAVEAAVRKADRIVADRQALRTRYGTRPDGPEAA